MLQIRAASLLKIGASVVTNWDSCYKLMQRLLQNRTAIKIWGKCSLNWDRYYKLCQFLQIEALQMGQLLYTFSLDKSSLREKCPNMELFLVRIFPHSD